LQKFSQVNRGAKGVGITSHYLHPFASTADTKDLAKSRRLSDQLVLFALDDEMGSSPDSPCRRDAYLSFVGKHYIYEGGER